MTPPKKMIEVEADVVGAFIDVIADHTAELDPDVSVEELDAIEAAVRVEYVAAARTWANVFRGPTRAWFVKRHARKLDLLIERSRIAVKAFVEGGDPDAVRADEIDYELDAIAREIGRRTLEDFKARASQRGPKPKPATRKKRKLARHATKGA